MSHFKVLEIIAHDIATAVRSQNTHLFTSVVVVTLIGGLNDMMRIEAASPPSRTGRRIMRLLYRVEDIDLGLAPALRRDEIVLPFAEISQVMRARIRYERWKQAV